MKPRIAAIAICALLLAPLFAAATPAAAPGAGKVAPAMSWSQLLSVVKQAVFPGWSKGAAPAGKPHRRSGRFLVMCDQGTILDPSGTCVPR